LTGHPDDVHVLRPGSGNALRLLETIRNAGHARPLVALAKALAASPPAQTMPDVVLAVREHPEPLLVFFGKVDRAAQARLADLAGLLAEAGSRLRILGWPDVEAASMRLAERLEARIGRDELGASVIVGAPRGGLIVAGLLAYAAGIPRTSFGDVRADQTHLLVDDCALSGVRLRERLQAVRASRIVVALLCAHPDLCAAVEAAEPRVVACVFGLPLHDHTAAILGSEEDRWRREWTVRQPGRYHAALLDLVSFPWSEPEVRLWNPVTERVEANWWLTPPASCLAHRAAGAAMHVQVVDDGPGISRLAGSTVPVVREDAITLVDTTHGRGVTLRGSSAELWAAWMEHGSAAADEIARRYGEPASRVARDLSGLVDGLSERGLLAD
jgi:hypothetical protein